MLDAADIAPQVTWGTSPEDVLPITGARARSRRRRRRRPSARAMERVARLYGPDAGHAAERGRRSTASSSAPAPTAASRICAPPPTIAKGRKCRRRRARAWSCPAPAWCKHQAEEEGLDRIFLEAGFEWREPGCSMCLAMNPDKLRARRALRLDLQPQFRGPPGPRRAHAPDEPGHGGGGGGDRPPHGCARADLAGRQSHVFAARPHHPGGNARRRTLNPAGASGVDSRPGLGTYSRAEVESWASGLVPERYVEAMNEGGETFIVAVAAVGLVGICSFNSAVQPVCGRSFSWPT